LTGGGGGARFVEAAVDSAPLLGVDVYGGGAELSDAGGGGGAFLMKEEDVDGGTPLEVALKDGVLDELNVDPLPPEFCL